ncbi:MAG: hypothetical protein V3V99_08635 [candidate division Zixibacteria bacterium]
MISRITKISLLVAVCLLFGVIAFSGEGEEEATKASGNLELQKLLMSRQAEFTKQMQEVEKQYPLVALAYKMQEAIIVQRTEAIEHTELDYYRSSLTGQNVVITEHSIQMKICLDKLKTGLMRAETDGDISNAFNSFGGCIRGD